MNDILKDLIKQFMPFAQKQIGFERPPRLFLRHDAGNAKNPLGKTAFYDPSAESVTLYVSGRHPKDILRSLGHELVHHKQNCDGEFSDSDDMGPGYAQRDPHLRDMEEKANRDGSMCLRDFEDKLKKENTIYYEHLQKGENKMSTKDWKNKEIGTLISEAWGFKFNSLQEFDEFNGNGEIQTEGEEEEEIEELAQAKGAGDRRTPHKRKTVPEDEKEDMSEAEDEEETLDEDEEIEEGLMDMIGLGDEEEEEDELEEGEKPDFLDIDKDGDKEESGPMGLNKREKEKICMPPTLTHVIFLIICPPLAIFFKYDFFTAIIPVIICGVLCVKLYYFPGLLFATLMTLC
mgnify:CR=1 FL=1